jgi:hypothetical protein
LLHQIKNTEATILYLELIKSVLKAYVDEETSVFDRIVNAVFAVYFIRIWRQYLNDNKISVNHFLTLNVWEGLELNLILLIKLALDNKAENIYFMNSQLNESFFRLLRSFTGMENLVVNCSMKGFISRLHRIQLEDFLMTELSKEGKITFPKLVSREKHKKTPKANLNENEIKEAVDDGIKLAIQKASQVGMNVEKLQSEQFLKPVQPDIRIETSYEPDDDLETEDFLRTDLDEFQSQNLNDDDTPDEIETFSLQDLLFLEKNSGLV